MEKNKNSRPFTLKMGDDIYNLMPRYGDSRSHHKKIAEKLSVFRDNYKQLIKKMDPMSDFFSSIAFEQPENPDEASIPYWSNDYLPPADAIPLCGFLYLYNPNIYLEIGSGNSTKFARRVISNFGLKTKIVSIDPEPRAEIDAICDSVLRIPIETMPMDLFQKLQENSILFIDSSHRSLQNSDVTSIFLDILPNLNPGVIIHFHDIFWPNDYPASWVDRYYNEQYLLGVLLLFGSGYEILYSSGYVRFYSELCAEFDAFSRQFLHRICLDSIGGSIWLKLITEA